MAAPFTAKQLESLRSKWHLEGAAAVRQDLEDKGVYAADGGFEAGAAWAWVHDAERSRVRQKSGRVFVVHGHDTTMLDSVAAFLKELRLTPVILRFKPGKGATLYEKLLEQADDISFSVVLMSPDDEVVGEGGSYRQARPNVLLELGFFIARLGRSHVSLVVKGSPYIASDILGVEHIAYPPDPNVAATDNNWRGRLFNELQAARVLRRGVRFKPL